MISIVPVKIAQKTRIFFLLLVALFLVFLCSWANTARAALPPEQVQDLQSGIQWFDTQVCGSGSSGATTTSSTPSSSSGNININLGNFSATVYTPGDNQPHPLVIFAPGRFQTSSNGFYNNYLQRTASQGFVVAGLNFTSNNSAGNIASEVQEINTAVQQLPGESQLSGLLSGPIGLIGHSDGAVDVVEAGYGVNQVKGLSAVIEEDGSVPFSGSGLPLGTPNSGPPLLLVHATNDPIQPISSGSDVIWSQVQSSYKGYAKFLTNTHDTYIVGNTAFGPAVDAITGAFLKRFLNGDTSSSTNVATVAGQYSSQVNFTEQGSETPTVSQSASSNNTSSTACCSAASTNVTLSGSNNIQQAFNFFVQQGLSPEQSAGLVGNLDAESGVLPGRQQSKPPSYVATAPIPNVGFGIAQWTSVDRQAGLVAFAQQQGKPDNDLGMQLAYVWQELNKSYGSTLSQLKATSSVDAASDLILNTYEIAQDHAPGGANSILRRTLSEQILTQYGGTAANVAGSSPTANACSSTTATLTSSGAYQNPLRSVQQLKPERIDQGVDYAGQGPVYALGNGTIENLTNSGWNFGGYDGFVVEKLSDGPAAGDYVYVAEGCVPASGLSIGEQVTASTVICNMINPNSTGIETGWATGSPFGASLAMQLKQWDGSDSTAMGQNYSELLQSLGAPAGIMQGHVTGSLPSSGWTNWQQTTTTL